MRLILTCFLLSFIVCTNADAQARLSHKTFFTDTSVIDATLVTDIGNLMSGKMKGKQQSGLLTLTVDSSTVTGKIGISARGNMRRETCKMPPVKVKFSEDSLSSLKKLGSLKLVVPCEAFANYEQFVLREYLAYKMLNLITDLSFKVRLVNIHFKDEKEKKKELNQYGFFIEDLDQLAKRNDCKALYNVKVYTEGTDKPHITLVSIFQYMIGNTDWSVPANHNIKLIQQKDSPTSTPFAVPYDFDYSGLVNAPYAIPDPILGINDVTERVYRGFTRTMNELEPIVQKFKDKKESIYALINDCPQLSAGSKKQMLKYLDDFYDVLAKPSSIKNEFIDKSRGPNDV